MGTRDRRIIVLSDVEMGAGDIYDDFPHPQFLARCIDRWGSARGALDLVFNGDTFDLLKVSVDGAWPALVTEAVALHKFERVVAAHGLVFEALGRFLDAPGRTVHFVVGNHDPELLFPAVQRRLQERIGAQVKVHPVGVTFGDVHIEHGSQTDPMFKFDPAAPFVDTADGPVLALPWGSLAVIEVALPLQPLLYDLDRLKTRRRVFEQLPEARDLLMSASWRYWTRDARAWFLGRHPVKQASWTMVKEIAYRFSTGDPDLHTGDEAYRARLRVGPERVIVAGHLHRAKLWSYIDRRLVVTGCFRDEFPLGLDGMIGRSMPKSYADIRLRDGRLRAVSLRELTGPPPPRGHVPATLEAVRERLRPHLLTAAEQRVLDAEAESQLEREAADRRAAED
ncbi:MAG: UDP-2,3-diacylglucosamine pyrophosphatase LpxH [Myxococcota bacterium]